MVDGETPAALNQVTNTDEIFMFATASAEKDGQVQARGVNQQLHNIAKGKNTFNNSGLVFALGQAEVENGGTALAHATAVRQVVNHALLHATNTVQNFAKIEGVAEARGTDTDVIPAKASAFAIGIDQG